MAHEPDFKRIRKRMEPGMMSLHGFLGKDRRKLRDILRADRETVDRLGITHQAIASSLAELTALASSGLGAPRRKGDLVVVMREARGFVRCPFGDPRHVRKGEVQLTNTVSGETLLWTPLSVHMIDAHGFYEGKGSRYRMEPEEAAEVLGLSAKGPDGKR